MRLATWKLAALMGVVPTIGCVQKIVPATDDRPIGGDDAGNGDGDQMDAAIVPGQSDAGKDAGNPDAGMSTGGLSCLTYCTEIQASCQGAFRQFESMQQCMNMCGDMNLGVENAASGDSVGCRLYHVRKGVMLGQLDVHCNHAGPTGGTICGDYCENLCGRVTQLCVVANGVQSDAYESYDDCMYVCQAADGGTDGYPVNREAELPATGDSVNCRIYHLANAYKYSDGPEENLQQLNAHCDHTREFSTLCTDNP
jgi:hypothetical protein